MECGLRAVESKLETIERAKGIVADCPTKINYLRKQSRLRVLVFRPDIESDHDFLLNNFDTYRRNLTNFKRNRKDLVFWGQTICWSHSKIPDMHRLNEGSDVFKSIIATFQSDVNLNDERIIRYWKHLAENPRNHNSDVIATLRLRVKELQAQCVRLERLLERGTKTRDVLEEQHKREKEVVFKAFLGRSN
jgi:hypothetical protein